MLLVSALDQDSIFRLVGCGDLHRGLKLPGVQWELGPLAPDLRQPVRGSPAEPHIHELPTEYRVLSLFNRAARAVSLPCWQCLLTPRKHEQRFSRSCTALQASCQHAPATALQTETD
jgi:hypothetical protein